MNSQYQEELRQVAKQMVHPEKGILAADESNPTIKKRFDSINVESTEENRRRYREIVMTTTDYEKYISGVILFDETLRQSTQDGTPFPKLLEDRGVLPGIKVDMGAHQLALAAEGEKVTEGLDGLRGRLEEYRGLGAKFAKWRAVITIAGELPSQLCMDVNAHALARYAALCQEQGIVPIVEPEVLMDGGDMDHDINRAAEVTEATLKAVFAELKKQNVDMQGMILKPSMVLPGKSADKATPEEIAKATLQVYANTIPAEMPGCVFLSGGQTPDEANANMNAINVAKDASTHPWEMTFSFGRGLQAPVLEAWQGKEENVDAAQAAFLEQSKTSSLARQGKLNS